MSNILTIEPTKFENVRTGETTFDVRIYDDYEAVYINTWESIPDDDLEVFEEVMEDDTAKSIIEAYFDSKIDDEDPVIMIGGVSYSKSELT